MGDTGPREFARLISKAKGAERARLFGSYRSWIISGARAQGAYGFGTAVFGISLGMAALAFVDHYASPLVLALCAGGVLVGGAFGLVAARRESAWRRANPWRDAGQQR